MPEGNWKRVLLALYEEYGYQLLKEYVEKTDNEWDDAILEAVDNFLRGFLGE